MEEVHQDEGHLNDMMEITPVQYKKNEQNQPEAKKTSHELEKINFLIKIPPESIPLVDLVTCNNSTMREQVFTAFVHHRLTYLSKNPRNLIEYVTNIKDVLEAMRVRLNAFRGEEAYHVGYHEDIIERGTELSQDGEWVEVGVSLPLLLVQCLEELSRMVGKTREWLANCFIIEEVESLHADPALIVEWWNEQGNFIMKLNARLNACRELMRTRNRCARNEP